MKNQLTVIDYTKGGRPFDPGVLTKSYNFHCSYNEVVYTPNYDIHIFNYDGWGGKQQLDLFIIHNKTGGDEEYATDINNIVRRYRLMHNLSLMAVSFKDDLTHCTYKPIDGELHIENSSTWVTGTIPGDDIAQSVTTGPKEKTSG